MSATDFVVTDSATETNTTTDALSNNSTEGRSSTAVEVETAAAEEYVSSLYRMPTGILVLCAFLAIGALVFATVSWIGIRVYRKTPIVAMAQPVFLQDICQGAFFLAAAILCFLPVLAYEDDGSGDPYQKPAIVNIVCCNLMTWCMYIGYATTFTPLLCKIYRIKLITDQPLRRGLKVLPRHVAGPYLLAMVIAFGSLIVWTVLDPYKYEVLETDPFAHENLGTCSVVMFVHTWQLSTYTLIFMGIILNSLLSVILVTLVVLAYRIRNINPELGDSQRIFRLVIFFLVSHIMWVISVIIVRSTKSMEGSTQYVILNFLSVLALFIDSVGIICFIVVPRLYFVWYQQKHGHLPEHVQMFGTGTIRINDSGNTNTNSNNNNNTNLST